MVMKTKSVDADADAKSAKKRKRRTTMRKTSANAAVADAKSAKKRTMMMTTNGDDVDAVAAKTIQTMLTLTTMKLPSKSNSIHDYKLIFIHTQEGERATLFQIEGEVEFPPSVPPKRN